MPLLVLCTTDDGPVEDGHSVDEIDELIAQPSNLVWLDIDGDAHESAAILEHEFGFHSLAIEDVQHRHQRPKVDQYEGYAFVVLYALGEATSTAMPVLHEINAFIGPNYLVTAHSGPAPGLDAARARWRQNPRAVGGRAALLFHALFNEIVDDYFPWTDTIAERIETAEVDLFEEFDETAVRQIFSTRKQLLALRRTLGPMRDVALVLTRRDLPFTDEATSPYFEDIYDHVIRLTDSIDISRDLLTSALDTYLSMTSNRLNQVVKRLTGASIILMTLATLAGIWGMNFQHMPELDWRLGYPFALATMAGVAGLIYVALRRKDYL